MTDPQRIDDFERDGFVVIPNALSADLVARLVNAGDRAVASDRTEMRQRMNGGETDGFRNAVALDDVFLEALAPPAVMPYLVRLLGPDIKLLTSHLIYRNRAAVGTPATHRSPGWHRDFAKAQRSLGHDRIQRLDIKAAYALTDIPGPGYGGTLFVPGSHTLREALDTPKGDDPAGAVEPAVKAGDCVLFENRTWHAGGPNLLGGTRRALMMGYTYVWVQSSDFDHQPESVLRKAEQLYGDIGLQLLCGLPVPEEFDYTYDSKPLEAWAEAEGVLV